MLTVLLFTKFLGSVSLGGWLGQYHVTRREACCERTDGDFLGS